MIIDVITIFPNFFDNFLNESIIKRALKEEHVTINIHNLRDYTNYSNQQVDDAPYGGGGGMVLMIEPIANAIKALKKQHTKVILLSPQGEVLKQSKVESLAKEQHLILLCGHYEGFDERILQMVDIELSIGDYVLTGGEIPAQVVIDSITRLIPGVIKKTSHLQESFNNNLLDYPTYTKPRDFNGKQVPEVLLSGDHAKIKAYREKQAKQNTKLKRPDLWRKYEEVQD